MWNMREMKREEKMVDTRPALGTFLMVNSTGEGLCSSEMYRVQAAKRRKKKIKVETKSWEERTAVAEAWVVV